MSTLWPYLIPPSIHGDDSRCAVSAHGHRITFADGSTVLDADSGLWNANLGFGNTAIAQAIAHAATEASYLHSFRFENTYARQAADNLIAVAGPDHYARVLFSSGGGVANDAAMKLVRQYQGLAGRPERNLVVALRGSFHGLTFGGFALTGEDLGQRVYGVDQRLIRHIAPNDVDELRALIKHSGDRIAAVVVEPVLGSGTIELTEQYIAELVALRDETGYLLVADEVATGFGRTGTFFASQTWPSPPDVLISSKGLTNGTCPASAVLFSHQIADAFTRYDAILTHAETQGGTAIPSAAISATLSEMHRLDAVVAGQRVAARLAEAIDDLVAHHPLVTGAAGRGCFRTLQIGRRGGPSLGPHGVAHLVAEIRRAGAIVHPGPAGIQLVPALTYSDAEVDELITCVEAGLTSLISTARSQARG
ncbi:aspartate aminotransferase family protein [Streptomyces sp. TRM66268-LWL]|uniref:Aspartate aminotransferase family protein n=1 Tax=Streptomyces polyasparticus TaxID=2767826 RepID=A0ABR7SX99_9ACTN|nr:daptide-type RiPP biosynthesis aminotransferase [Streptomyces polyasparticus]MBC9718883.1 aspartate aminotransferase family protein [Streptomyces polyasparticus]